MESRNRATGSGALQGVTIRTQLQSGDLGAIVSMHGLLYAKEHGFDHTFEAYVAGPLAECVRAALPGDRIWLAEKGGRIAGSVAIVGISQEIAQLRWFLVDPGARGSGLGMTLLEAAVAFSKECGYRSIILWTVSALSAAAHLYLKAGFRKLEESPGRKWGVSVIEEKYEMALR